MKTLFAGMVLCGAQMALLATWAPSQQIVTSTPAVEPGNNVAEPGNSVAEPADNAVESGNNVAEPGNTSTSFSLPRLPKGKTTIIGGQIRNFDPVRDQFSIRSYGERPMKIWFDERTQVYRDGKRISVRDLGPEDHASVETTLDGPNVFAVSIHILSETAEGECEGRIVRYDPGKGELVVASQMSPAPVIFLVPANASIARVGERKFTMQPSGLSDLVAGALVSVSFEAGAARRNVARDVKVMAVPGAAFQFSGNISFLDMHTGTMVLVDPRDGKSYQIHFDSARLPASETLHPQANVSVTATYDGTGYAASAITAN
jgi:hypothetical protein